MHDHIMNLTNALEHIDAIINDTKEIEPNSDLNAAALHGFIREIQAQAITAIIAIQAIQTEGRKNGYEESDA
jgi:hypothetical protein